MTPLEQHKSQIFFWIDNACMDQAKSVHGQEKRNPTTQLYVNSLPLYVACCLAFVTIQHPELESRAWIRVERAMSYASYGDRQPHLCSRTGRTTIRAQAQCFQMAREFRLWRPALHLGLTLGRLYLSLRWILLRSIRANRLRLYQSVSVRVLAMERLVQLLDKLHLASSTPLLDPRQGKLSQPSEMEQVRLLTQTVERFQNFSLGAATKRSCLDPYSGI